MSKKQRVYSAEFKTKLVLEVLKGEKTINQIASEHNITPKNLQNWKKTFLENAEIAMEPSRAVKEYKDEIENLNKQNEAYAKMVGKLTIERDWLLKKVRSLDLSKRKSLVDSKLNNLSITRQCQLLGFARNDVYYKHKVNSKKDTIKQRIVELHSEIPIYGQAKVYHQLLDEGFKVSENTIAKYRKELGLRAILALNRPITTIPNKQHKKYSYKLNDTDINKVNQVWCSDITYVALNNSFVYLTAILDWKSKAMLSYKISNTQDEALATDVLDEALEKYPKPDYFNTDQGSVYTSNKHTKRLEENDVIISMDSKGRAYDNIIIERFWRSVKYERIYLNEYNSIDQLKQDISDYMDFYNNRRLHENLDYKKPMEVYLEGLKDNYPDWYENNRMLTNTKGGNRERSFVKNSIDKLG
jgi:putative transposase